MATLEQLGFRVERRLRGVRVPDEPHFDSPESTAWFVHTLRNAKRYLEFGSGGSTYLAAQLGVPFATVESDPDFLAAVHEKITHAGYARHGQVFHYADIGPTGRWGFPVGEVTAAREEQFRRYSDIPAPFIDGTLPDLVLVDGRFRVACALKVMRWCMTRRVHQMIVVDDYSDKWHDYRVLDDFAELRMVGRMAVLTAWKPTTMSHLNEAIDAWETRWH